MIVANYHATWAVRGPKMLQNAVEMAASSSKMLQIARETDRTGDPPKNQNGKNTYYPKQFRILSQLHPLCFLTGGTTTLTKMKMACFHGLARNWMAFGWYMAKNTWFEAGWVILLFGFMFDWGSFHLQLYCWLKVLVQFLLTCWYALVLLSNCTSRCYVP